MKRLMFLICLVPLSAIAAAPSTSCPSGYIAVDAPYITIATACPSGTISVGTAESCLATSPAGNCIMYAPVDVPFTDDSGTYEYTEPCALQ